MACKYPGTDLRGHSLRNPGPGRLLVGVGRAASLLAFSLGWAVVMSPGWSRTSSTPGTPSIRWATASSMADTGTRRCRRNGRTCTARDRSDLAPRRGSRVRLRLVEVAGRSDWQSPLYVALAPLALLRPGSRRLVLALWGYVAYLFLTWWFFTHRLDRFWLPLLPVLAVLAGLGGDWIRHRGWSILLGLILSIVLLTNLTYVSTALAGFNEWTGDSTFLRDHIPRAAESAVWRPWTQSLPDRCPVLLVGQAAVFHRESSRHLQHRLQHGNDRDTGQREGFRGSPTGTSQALT